MLLRIAVARPSGRLPDARAGRRAGRGARRPADPAEPARGPHHQTTVAPVAASDRPSGPKVRTPGRRRPPARPADTRNGMLGQDRSAPGGGPDPARPARARPRARQRSAGPRPAASGRQCVPAGRMRPAADPAADAVARPASSRRRRRRARRPPAGGWPWRTRWPPPAAWPWCSPSPGTTSRPRAARPGGAGARRARPAGPRRASGSGLVFGLAFFVPLLSWTGIYVGRAARGWRWPSARRCTWRCSAAPPP